MKTFLKVLKHILMITGSFILTVTSFVSLFFIVIGIAMGVEWLIRNIHVTAESVLHLCILLFFSFVFGQCWWSVYQSMKKDLE